jgi:hypothetical protein
MKVFNVVERDGKYIMDDGEEKMEDSINKSGRISNNVWGYSDFTARFRRMTLRDDTERVAPGTLMYMDESSRITTNSARAYDAVFTSAAIDSFTDRIPSPRYIGYTSPPYVGRYIMGGTV